MDKLTVLLLILLPTLSYQQSFDAMLYGNAIYLEKDGQFAAGESKGLIVVTDTMVGFYRIDLRGNPALKFSYDVLERNNNNVICYDNNKNEHRIILISRGKDEMGVPVITRIEDVNGEGSQRDVYDEDVYQSVLLDGYLRNGGWLPKLTSPKIPKFEVIKYRKQYRL
jgi:hypothetical protein